MRDQLKFNMKAHCLTVLLCLLMSTMTAFAQEFTASGTVLDQQEEPLIGVTVMVAGTNSGTSTDLDGKFSINVKKGQVLRFNYVGCKPFEYKVTGSAPITVHL